MTLQFLQSSRPFSEVRVRRTWLVFGSVAPLLVVGAEGSAVPVQAVLLLLEFSFIGGGSCCSFGSAAPSARLWIGGLGRL